MSEDPRFEVGDRIASIMTGVGTVTEYNSVTKYVTMEPDDTSEFTSQSAPEWYFWLLRKGDTDEKG